MDFTFESYKDLVRLIIEAGYTIVDFENCDTVIKPCVLRHDVDMSPIDALNIAELEAEMGVSSTYYVLLNTGFYNVFHSETNKILRKIAELGHSIGLHFDAKQYEGVENTDVLCEKLLKEKAILEGALDIKIGSFSIHRPTELLLESKIHIDGMINTYSEKFFRKFKYISDSRMRWREDPVTTITSGSYDSLQVLTHPIWYSKTQTTLLDVLKSFSERLNNKTLERLSENVSSLDINSLK